MRMNKVKKLNTSIKKNKDIDKIIYKVKCLNYMIIHKVKIKIIRIMIIYTIKLSF